MRACSRYRPSLIALLPDERTWATFQRIIPPDVDCVRVCTVREFSSRLRLEPTWRVLDLSPFNRQPAHVMAEILSSDDNPKTIVWTEIGPESATGVLRLSLSSPTDVIWRGANEDAMLEAALRYRVGMSATGVLMHLLAPQISLMRPDVAMAILALGGGPVPQRVKQFVAFAQLGRRMIERSVQAAGFSGAAGLLGALRIAATWRGLVEFRSVKAIALDAGYTTAAAYGADFRRYVGMAPTEARSVLDVWTLAMRLHNAITRRLNVAAGPRP